MSKTFTIVGTSVLGTKSKFRFANGTVKGRARVLERNGHKDIDLIELPCAMTKQEAQAFFEEIRAPKLKVTKEVPAEQMLQDLGIAPAVEA
jgi:hypothetical protein